MRSQLHWVLGVVLVAACSDSDSGGESRNDTADDVADVSEGLDTAPIDLPDTAALDADMTEEDVEGGFRTPCLENSDCNSGYCIDTDEGSVCTRTCSENCPDGWRCAGVQTSSADVVFLCTPIGNRLCAPCTVDTQCAGGFCLTDGAGQKTCSRPCGDNDACPTGFACEETASEGGSGQTSRQCLPVTGRCDCTPLNEGEQRPCSVDNASGRCWGLETCDASLGWVGCDAATPVPEACNGADDDCDGIADEEVTAPEEACATTNDFGTCTGTWSCRGEVGWRCDARTPAVESCNYADDDCDGVVDDGYADEAGRYVADAHCGVCGNACDGKIAFATDTSCALVDGAATCIASACEAGYFVPVQTQRACVPIAGGAQCGACFGDQGCADLEDGRCELLDGAYRCTRGCSGPEDCDAGFGCDGGRCVPLSGSCECLAANAGNTRTCYDANASGVCFGTQTCDPGSGWSGCTASTPSTEVCNGLDDDCDQQIDELVVHDPPTCANTNAFGACSAPYLCGGAAGWRCEAREPAEDTCNYQDDDCDGTVDEGFLDPATGRYLALENCGACGISCIGALPNATETCALSSEGVPRCEVDRCDRGYFQSGPLACTPASAGACTPCESDHACRGGLCATLTDGRFCLNPCEGDENCGAGYSCVTFPTGRFCEPDTRSCLCDGTDTTLFRGCEEAFTPATGAPYTCFGTQQCTETGWSACTLGAETCNLLDDDCDGQTDEDFLVNGAFADDENCGQCGNDCTLLDFAGGGGVCNTAGAEPRCSLRCDSRCFDLNANPNDGCECCDPSPVDLPDPLGTDSNCDGIDGEKGNAIFVAKWGLDANSGLWGAPKRTVAAALTAARTLGKRDVYVATGVYQESVSLQLGVGLYGGYASDFATRDSGLFETVLLGPSPTAARPAVVDAVRLTGGTPGRTVLDGFSVYGPDVRTPGASSFAVRVLDSDSSVAITRNRIYAGSGGKGTRGFDGTDGADAAPGLAGRDAFDVSLFLGFDLHPCTANQVTSAGGAGGASSCGAVDTSGGSGGLRLCPTFSSGLNTTTPPAASEQGLAGKKGGTTSAASGGAAGWNVFQQRFSCEGYDTYGPVEGRDGADGGGGTNGAAGSGCSDGDGRIVDGIWTAANAVAGGNGGHGGGGGGGGSGAGAVVHDSCYAKGLKYENIGGTGGGGGAGGCAGSQGQPGSSGGGAFGMLVVFTASPTTLPILSENILTGGLGGDGGDGGNGGVGGSGGAGAFGGAAGGEYAPSASPPVIDADYPAFKGGKGGKGGNGGHGGGGGGGCGGPAFGIYVDGAQGFDLSPWRDDNAFPGVGGGGQGGLGGFSLGGQGGSGASGPAAATNF
jgi:hypothetical protein